MTIDKHSSGDASVSMMRWALERGSLGGPAAAALRAYTTPDEIDRILDRAERWVADETDDEPVGQ